MQCNFIAHIAEDGRKQTVLEHLELTADISSRFAGAFGAGPQGKLIGLAHDIGKCSNAFQARLNGGIIVDHASAGALECAKANHLWAACCITGHHGGLPDVGNLRNDTADDPTLVGRLQKAIHGGIPSYQLPVELPDTLPPNGYNHDPLTDSFLIRMLFSCLVDADFLDTEQFMSNSKTRIDHGKQIPDLLEKLQNYIEPWWNPTSELNRNRCKILKSCIRGSVQEKGIFTLTVPTGGGKTIASVAFALNHAMQHGMDRVIYVIPYTSIIEQTAAVFRRVFGDENVVEHHTNAQYEVPEHGDVKQYQQIKATENWDAPIIVTTAVQFFESLYSNRPSKCRKLHNIANSVIIFDEAQMLPTEHLRPCIAAISTLVARFRATAVLCTATQPSLNDLFKEYAPGYEVRELWPEAGKKNAAFQRVTFQKTGTVNADSLSERLAAHLQVLCIVNSRKSAQEVFRLLPEEGRFHLSTLMYPAHRRAVFAEIRDRLKAGLPCRVVSTSLIEAGVDVDFPAVFREMAGLDSILQAAGRCNREGKRPASDSIVTVFDGLSLTPQLLRVNIGAAKEALKSGADPQAPDTITQYYAAYRSLAGDKLDKVGVISAFEYGVQGRMLPFRTVAERFHLIDDTGKTVYIPQGDGAELVQRLKAGERTRSLFRALGRYAVNVYETHFLALQDRGALELLDENSAVLTDLRFYVSKMGLILCDKEDTGYYI